MTDGAQVLKLSGVTVRRGSKNILGPIDWEVNLSQRWVVLGPNGAGKTTLLGLCSSTIHPTSGAVAILGQILGKVDVFELRNRIGITSAVMVDRIPADEKVKDVVLSRLMSVSFLSIKRITMISLLTFMWIM